MIFERITSIDYIFILCHLSVVGSLFTTALLFLFKSRKKDRSVQLYMYGIILFMLLYGIARLLFFIFELSVSPFPWNLSMNEANSILQNDATLYNLFIIIWYISTILSWFALFIFLFVLERYILEKKQDIQLQSLLL